MQGVVGRRKKEPPFALLVYNMNEIDSLIPKHIKISQLYNY